MNPALDELTLTGLRATAFHGVFDHERRDGQVFIVDAVVYLDLSPAALSDQLNRTVHYGELAEQIVAAVESNPVDLIETVAERVANIVLAYDAAVSTKITIHKPSAPITVPFADVTVTITRHRPAAAHPAGFSAEPRQLS
jgi:dihydroneopterin aldolase